MIENNVETENMKYFMIYFHVLFSEEMCLRSSGHLF